MQEKPVSLHYESKTHQGNGRSLPGHQRAFGGEQYAGIGQISHGSDFSQEISGLATYCLSTNSASALACASVSAGKGGIGICPHLLTPPMRMLASSLASACASPLYFTATSW